MISRVEGSVRGELMMSDAALATFCGAGGRDKIAQIADPLSSDFLPLYTMWEALLHEIGAAVVFPLGIANSRCSSMKKGGSSGGRNVLAESGEERSAMMRVHRKRSHELRSVLADLRE